jgi:deoxyribodipyrimidine photolyase
MINDNRISIREKLENYKAYRNNPTRNGLSNLSLYLHFVQISAQRIAFELYQTGAHLTSRSVNYCAA